MRTELGIYSNRYIKVVGTFVKTSQNKGGAKNVLITNLINADNGQFLTDHLWIEETRQMKQLHLLKGEKIFFIGKVTTYEKGYRGHNLGKVLSTKAPTTDYHIINVQNVIRQTDVINDSEYLKKLRYRKKYIETMKANDDKQKEDLERQIAETEMKKDRFRNNPLLYVKPIRTIEVLPSNRFISFPLLYAFVDSVILNHFENFLDLIRHFINICRHAKQYNKCRAEIRAINSEIICRYREARKLFRRKRKIDVLLSELDGVIKVLESELSMTQNVIWEQTYDDAYAYGNHTQKALKP